MAAFAPAVGAVLAQVRVDSKTNEHKAALELLGIIPPAGKVVTGDAIFCQRDLAKQVIEAGGHYVLVAKDNHPAPVVDIEGGFAFEAAARSVAAPTSPGTGPGVRSVRSVGHLNGQESRAPGEAHP
ncbi:transposase : Transposase OS=Azospirillum sp. (strain B510) GN=AZL_b01830 PE=4 SV=1: DDE_Tnp_1 [Gemmata massiliana]|uniref:Transposase IS4-like domain-containing protein n=1 Tax=Gemmata massiliana TaxID=1210884 RepID=A0A6P2CZU7_9BACT|nr:transposase : Transposase OS=Azospirillum sp. (strain B510) GN=AZL_b01830 PE=4 SV=1: DDE_Tnp_1 [Gemmata massiliana]